MGCTTTDAIQNVACHDYDTRGIWWIDPNLGVQSSHKAGRGLVPMLGPKVGSNVRVNVGSHVRVNVRATC